MSVSRKGRWYLGVSALGIISSHTAYAQNPPPAAPAAPEQVLITGSLLGNANFEAPTPVTQIGAVQVETRSLTGIGTLIEELPFAQTGQGLTRNTNGIIAAAQSLPNLRGLGANDTLVLINGQRPTPINPTNNFDTDMIPSSLLDRFEVVTSGASASYGSDAVAGVVNFILKDRLEGFTSNTQYGTSQRGDENQFIGSAAYGTAFAGGKGHFIIGGEFAKQYGTVNMYARAWGRNEPGLVALPVNRALGPDGKPLLPANLLTNHAEIDNGTQGGLITGCSPAPGCPVNVSFTANGTPYNFPFGSIVGGSYMVGTGNYGVSSLNRQLSPPYQRSAGLARIEYDITPDINAYATVNYGQLESNDPSQGSPFPIVLTVLSGNPYIPPSIQAVMTANHINSITLAKENLDGMGTGNTANNKNTLLQSFFGVKGSIFNDWNWDLQGSAGRAVVWQAFSNVELVANLDSAAYVVKDANGTPVCGPAATNPVPFKNPTLTTAQIAAQAYPGCQPYNPFGVPSAGSLNYITNAPDGVDGSKANIRQYMFNADLRGSPYTLPAGPIDLAVGANWRRNSYNQLGSPPAAAGLYQTRNPPTFFIDQDTWEAYGEVGVPVVKDLPFAKSVDLNGAARYTDYSITGGVTTWKYGGTWDINDMIRLRATRSQDIRAPNFTELNPLPVSSATNVQNPISGISQRVSNILTTGNPNLKPEFAENTTAGIVFQPTYDFLSGFRASVDYYRIRISGQIAAVNGPDVVNRCLLLHLQDFCNQITFTNGTHTPGPDISTAFGITTLHLFSVNLNSEIQDGWDFNLSEHFVLDSIGVPGSFDLSALGSYINEQRVIQAQSDGSVISINQADTTTAPRWSWNVNFTYNLERLTANLQMRYYSPIKYATTNIGPDDRNFSTSNPLSINQNIWPAAITFNLHLAYDVIQEPDGQDLQVYFNIDNLLDKDPPIIWWYVSNYDVVGRFFKLGVRYTMP
ncbi:MAG TPA: TonB-dependent receptor [Micropepsaceae bacterium]|nr:TonB-dependent receptor [Micropepsaceae bacterium]